MCELYQEFASRRGTYEVFMQRSIYEVFLRRCEPWKVTAKRIAYILLRH